ncbi:MAG: hypothetical protein IPP51_13800 [Bacteroidetes bacterium]|nr:hypothetical protein [Bacteroidota bacterium]
MTLFLILRFVYGFYFRFPHFSIRKSSLRTWKSKNKDRIITCTLELKTKKCSDELIFEELWIDEKLYKFKLTKDKLKTAYKFRKKEVLRLDAISEIPDHAHSSTKPKKGKVLLTYTFKNKRRHLSINKFTDKFQLPGIA